MLFTSVDIAYGISLDHYIIIIIVIICQWNFGKKLIFIRTIMRDASQRMTVAPYS